MQVTWSHHSAFWKMYDITMTRVFLVTQSPTDRWWNRWASPEMLNANLLLLQCVLLGLSGSLSLFPPFHLPPQTSLLRLPGGYLLFPHLTKNSLSLPSWLLWFQSLLSYNQTGKLKMLLSIPNHGWPTRHKPDPTASMWSHAISNTLSPL